MSRTRLTIAEAKRSLGQQLRTIDGFVGIGVGDGDILLYVVDSTAPVVEHFERTSVTAILDTRFPWYYRRAFVPTGHGNAGDLRTISGPRRCENSATTPARPPSRRPPPGLPPFVEVSHNATYVAFRDSRLEFRGDARSGGDGSTIRFGHPRRVGLQPVPPPPGQTPGSICASPSHTGLKSTAPAGEYPPNALAAAEPGW